MHKIILNFLLGLIQLMLTDRYENNKNGVDQFQELCGGGMLGLIDLENEMGKLITLVTVVYKIRL